MIKFNKRKKLALHRLPFIGGKSKSGFGLSFWSVPSTGGYSGGCITGAALAWIWLKHLENEARQGEGNTPFTISRIVSELSDLSENDSLKGQMIGFFEIIEIVLFKLISDSRIHFTKDEKKLIEQANAGLKGITKGTNDEIH
ncbi:hypothetical protein [Atlantibacter hermannii]|uniref:hypothetical protein n=1 Tax=Atlantibacter hermannii TaxID=565 RepID=UPI0028988A99|nr:hypothetical protein [Atlantibacter hermannii]